MQCSCPPLLLEILSAFISCLFSDLTLFPLPFFCSYLRCWHPQGPVLNSLLPVACSVPPSHITSVFQAQIPAPTLPLSSNLSPPCQPVTLPLLGSHTLNSTVPPPHWPPCRPNSKLHHVALFSLFGMYVYISPT